MMTASMTTVQSAADNRQFPKFDLYRLLHTVFQPTFGCKICILSDLPDLSEARDMAFLQNPARAIQRRAHQYFYLGLQNGVVEETGLAAGVQGHPAIGVAWLAMKLAPWGESLRAGEIVLAGSFTRPVAAQRGDVFEADYGRLGRFGFRFV